MASLREISFVGTGPACAQKCDVSPLLWEDMTWLLKVYGLTHDETGPLLDEDAIQAEYVFSRCVLGHGKLLDDLAPFATTWESYEYGSPDRRVYTTWQLSDTNNPSGLILALASLFPQLQIADPVPA